MIRGDILESTYFIPIFVLFLVLYITRKREQDIILKIIKNRKSEDKKEMWELANKFKGKECIIYTFNSQITGVIKEVENGAILLDSKGTLEVVNFDYIMRIREYPKNKNGKKKAVVID